MKLNLLQKRTLLFLFILIVLIIFAFSSYAADSELIVEDIEADKVSEICKNLNISLIKKTDINYGFSCFAVNEQCDYALGFSNLEKHIIQVYNSFGEYIYGYSFECSGNFGIGWDNGNIVIYTVRSNLVITVDNQGICLDVKKISDITSNQDYLRKQVYSNTKVVNGITYTAEGLLFSNQLINQGSYPRLTKTTIDGERIILFDNSVQMFLWVWIATVLIILFIIVTVIGLFIKLKRRNIFKLHFKR